MQISIEKLTGEISSGRDHNGRILEEAEIKVKSSELIELKRHLQKEFPRGFSVGN